MVRARDVLVIRKEMDAQRERSDQNELRVEEAFSAKKGSEL